jgi:uncharacterized protein (TIGR02145 family)
LVSFSAVVRDANNQPLVNTPVSIRLTFKQGGQSGPLVYCALHQTTTNQNGFMSLQLNRDVLGTGCNGAPSIAFENIPWKNGGFWMEVEYQTAPTSPFVSLGQLELASSFYAFAAGTAERIAGFDLSGANNGDVLTYNITTQQWEAMPPSGSGFSGNYNDLTNLPNLSAINTDNQQLSVSATGDTLRLQNGGFVIIPGISAANTPAQLATLSTTAASSITGTTAASGGNITNSGGATITARGIVWSTSQTPSLSNNLGFTSNGTGTGSFTSTLTGLTANTTYYVRAYATNSAGTAYGNQLSFTTITGGGSGTYPPGSVFCTGTPTAVVEVTNPTTGRIWMDRNLGATQAATSSTDANSYGDLYQWGRRSDGHQCRNSATTSTLSSTDQPAHGNFIIGSWDWRSPQNDNLWQGVNGINNPCPSGYRLPTETELNAERLSWSQNNSAGAFASPLKLPVAGTRDGSNGSLTDVGSDGGYWSSTVSSDYSRSLYFYSSDADMGYGSRADVFSVRCLKD